MSRNLLFFVKEEFLHKKILEKENVFGYFWPETHYGLWSMEYNSMVYGGL